MGRELGCIGGGYPTGDGKRGCLIGINFGPLSNILNRKSVGRWWPLGKGWEPGVKGTGSGKLDPCPLPPPPATNLKGWIFAFS